MFDITNPFVALPMFVSAAILTFIILISFEKYYKAYDKIQLYKNTKISFNDIIGSDHIKEELKKCAHVLNDKTRKNRPCRGFMFTGNAGSGKTFMAKAFASECGLPFVILKSADEISIKIIRYLYAPCIVFIDEINYSSVDALLKEMSNTNDYPDNKQIIFICSSAYIDTSNSNYIALLRSGRLEKKITFTNPTDDEIKTFINHMTNKYTIKLSDEMINKIINNHSVNTYAEYEYIINDIKSKTIGEDVKMEDVLSTLDDKIFGTTSSKIDVDVEQLNCVVHHECAHALIAYLLKTSSKPSQININQKGGIIAHVQIDKSNDVSYNKRDLIHQIFITIASMVGESRYYQESCMYGTGCSNDIHTANLYVHTFNELHFLDFDIQLKDIKEDIASIIDSIINTHIDAYHKLIKLSLEKKIVTYDDMKEIIGENNENSINIKYEIVLHDKQIIIENNNFKCKKNSLKFMI